MDPGRWAVTTTPSILPSASELTIPDKAAVPAAGPAWTPQGMTSAAASVNISLARMGLTPDENGAILPYFRESGGHPDASTFLFGHPRCWNRHGSRTRACRGGNGGQSAVVCVLPWRQRIAGGSEDGSGHLGPGTELPDEAVARFPQRRAQQRDHVTACQGPRRRRAEADSRLLCGEDMAGAARVRQAARAAEEHRPM